MINSKQNILEKEKVEEPQALPVDANPNVQVYPSHREAPPVPQAYTSTQTPPTIPQADTSTQVPPPIPTREASVIAGSAMAAQYVDSYAPPQVCIFSSLSIYGCHRC